MKYINEAGAIESKYINLSRYAFDVYKYVNPEKFPKEITIPYLFDTCLSYIEQKHKQKIKHELIDFHFPNIIPANNKVLLAFSGGLDSVYQAFHLRELGYEVILFHVKNMNYYTNGKEYTTVKQFSDIYQYPLILANIKQNNNKNNIYRKYWKENSFKNILIYSLLIDYCIEEGIKKISCGDDLRLNLFDSVVGTNVADSKEVTLSFTNLVPYKFLWVDNTIHKGQRLEKLIQYNTLDLFYSCVNPGRFNQSNHTRIENKYNIKLEHYNCGVCRKCAFHSLIRYYYFKETYPKEFIDFCWTKIANGADYEFFSPSLSLQDRINNLYNY